MRTGKGILMDKQERIRRTLNLDGDFRNWMRGGSLLWFSAGQRVRRPLAN
jgi:hypothetical protein